MRYLRFNDWLDSIAGEYHDCGGSETKAQLIVYEACHNRGGAATEVANGLTTRVQEFCARHHIEHTSCHTQTLKKHATRSGNASKEAMMDVALERWRIHATDDNEADALALLSWALDGCPQPERAKKKRRAKG